MKKFLLNILVIIMLFASMNNVVFAETVIFNWKTLKYHKQSCQWAKKCTVNCTKIDKKEVIKLGGKPCKVCGG